MPSTNFGFKELNPSDQVGYTSVNSLIEGTGSIDAILNTRIPALGSGFATVAAGSVLRWDGSAFVAGKVGATWLDDGAVTEAKITAGAVTEAKIGTGAVSETKIASNAITNDKMADNAINTSEIVNSAVTAGKLAATLDLSTKTITLPNGVMIDGAVVTPSTDDSAKVATTAFVQDAVQNYSSGVGVINYNALANDAKTYDVPTSGTGVYFTASGDFTSASLSTASAQNPIVVSAASSAITLSLPNNIGTEGCTITVCQTGTGAVTISPKSGSAATINGSTSNTYVLGDQYSVVTLLCLSNSGSNGTWIITGDYI